PVSFDRGNEAAVDVNRRLGFFESPRQRDAEIRMFRFAGAVYHAAHHRYFHLFHIRVTSLPHRHLFAQIRLNLFRYFLEEGAGGASAAGTGGYLRGEAANAERLEDLLCYANFFGAVAVRGRSQGDTNRIADAFLQQYAERSRGSH